MASLLVVRSSILNLRERLLHRDPKIYCLMLSRTAEIGLERISISVRPPTIMCASPRMPTQRGKIWPGRGEITERSSDLARRSCEPSQVVTAEGLIQSSFPVTAHNADKGMLEKVAYARATASLGRPASFSHSGTLFASLERAGKSIWPC